MSAADRERLDAIREFQEEMFSRWDTYRRAMEATEQHPVDFLAWVLAELAAAREREETLREALDVMAWNEKDGLCWHWGCDHARGDHSPPCLAARAALAAGEPPS